MTTFLYPVCDYDNVIHTIQARSLQDAKDKIMFSFIEEYDHASDDSWDTFIQSMAEYYDISIGEPEDINQY